MITTIFSSFEKTISTIVEISFECFEKGLTVEEAVKRILENEESHTCGEETSSPNSYSRRDLLNEYDSYRNFCKNRLKSKKRFKNENVRLPSMPEDISENIIKIAIQKNDKTTTRDRKIKKSGDLFSQVEGKQECKCFTSDGPISFSPSPSWNVIYFLDLRNSINDEFVLFRTNLSSSSEQWKNLKLNKKQNFSDQSSESRRPRICWDSLYPQIKEYTEIISSGSITKLIKGEI